MAERGAGADEGGEAAEPSAVSGPVVDRHGVASQSMRHLVAMDARRAGDRITGADAERPSATLRT